MNERIEYSESAHDETIGAIEQLFRGSLSKERADRVSKHVLSCDRCDRVYQRYAEAERALFASTPRGAELFTPFAQDRVSARLFGDAPVRKKKLPQFLLGTASAGAVAALAMVLLIPRGDFTARGDEDRLKPESTLRVLAVESIGESFSVVDLAAGDRALKIGDRLKLLADTSAEQKFASAIVVAEDGRVLAEIAPHEIGANASDVAVGDSIPVDHTWPKGQVTIVLRLSREAKAAEADATPEDDGTDSVRVLKARVGEAH